MSINSDITADSSSRPRKITARVLAGLNIAQIGALLAKAPTVERRLFALLEKDRRAGVRRLAVRERTRQRLREAEEAREARMRELESRLWDSGLTRVAGVDEVGRGCLAGPVVAAAVVLKPGTVFPGIDDSKKLKPELRLQFRDDIAVRAARIGIGVVEAADIDRLNILEASMKAMRQALARLGSPGPEHVLVDGACTPGSPYVETAIVGGDARSASIAAASIVAKVHRDEIMVSLDRRYPGYGFASNKGYGSGAHLAAIEKCGPCPLHRRSFGPLADLLRPEPSRAYLAFEESFRSSVSLAELARAAGPLSARGRIELSPAELAGLRRLYRERRHRLSAVGVRGEAAAADYLEVCGYAVLERQYRGAGGEVDLIARRDNCLVFVEVKTRLQDGSYLPEERVRSRKRAHLTRTARHYLARLSLASDIECRFDVVAVVLRGRRAPKIRHLKDAFQASVR